MAEHIARELDGRCTYKPDHELHFRHVEDKIVFHLDARTLDSRTGTPNTAIGYTYIIPIPGATPTGRLMAYVLAEVRKALHLFEAHESDEWFKIDHVQHHPPHQHYPPETP